MSYYDEQLQELEQQVARKNRLETELKVLHTKCAELSEKVQELKKQKMNEQKDVDRLEGHSLAAFYYHVIGKKDEMLSKEQREAYEAAVKYDVAAGELEAMKERIRRDEDELFRLQNCEQRYEEAFKVKIEAVKASSVPEATEIFELEKRISCLENQKKEIGEAISAGQKALQYVDKILSELGSAESWGTWDLFGGGLVSDIAKHSHLDDAQEMVGKLQIALREFKMELTDVKISADIKVNIDGFLRFADYFFDGLFADWAVLDKIENSKEQVYKTRTEVNTVLRKLIEMQSAVEKEQEQLKSEAKQLVLKVSV